LRLESQFYRIFSLESQFYPLLRLESQYLHILRLEYQFSQILRLESQYFQNLRLQSQFYQILRLKLFIIPQRLSFPSSSFQTNFKRTQNPKFYASSRPCHTPYDTHFILKPITHFEGHH